MSEFEKVLKDIGGEHIEIKSSTENNINPLEIQNYNVRKVDIDLNNSEITTFNPFDNKGYAVTCSKCKSTNVKYDHHNTKFNHQNKKVSVPVKCLDCDYEVIEER